jgi:hypothetical protein
MTTTAWSVPRSLSRPLVVGAAAALAVALTAPGTVSALPAPLAPAPASSTGPFPPGVYGIIAVPTVHIKPRWVVDLTVKCARACKGTLSLRTTPVTGLTQRITSYRHFAVAAPSGGSVEVSLRLNRAGRAAFRASHHALATTAVMRYAAVGGYSALTETYPVFIV